MAGPVRRNSKWWMQQGPPQGTRKEQETREKEVKIKVKENAEPNPRKLKCVCGDCGKAYGTGQKLAQHFLQHHVGDHTSCRHCTRQRRCQRHETYYNWNTKSRDRYQCAECPSAFTHRKKLESHQHKDHPETRAELSRQQQALLGEARDRNGMIKLFGDGRLNVEERSGESRHVKDDTTKIGFVLQNDRRKNLDFVLN